MDLKDVKCQSKIKARLESSHPLVPLVDPGDRASAELSSPLIISGLKCNSYKIFQTPELVVRPVLLAGISVDSSKT